MSRRAAGLVVAGAVLALPNLVERVITDNRQRRAGEEAACWAREGAEWAREALAVQAEEVALMAANAIANPRFQAALRGNVDGETFADLLATESWWEPYRDLLAAISYDGTTLAFTQTEGKGGLPIAAIVSEVAAGDHAVARLMSGARGAFLVAARPAPLGPGRRPAVLLLARRLDDRMLETLSARPPRWAPTAEPSPRDDRARNPERVPNLPRWAPTAEPSTRDALLVSDGRRALASAGSDGARLLATLVGQEARGDVALSDPSVHASAIAIGPGLWLWALGLARAREPAAAMADRSRLRLSWAMAIPVAAVIGARSLRRGKRTAAAPPPAPVDARASTAAMPVVTVVPDAPVVPTMPDLVTMTAEAAPRAWPGPGTALGRYLLVERIGEGGMAELFTAVSFGYGRFRRPFVIKRLRPELNANPTAVGLFIDEANLASTLVHPNVVPVFDFGEAAGCYFLAQEYVVGRDVGRLNRRLKDRGEPALSTEIVLHLAHQLLLGLQYAHEKRDDAGTPLGLVHRDITPENVIVSERGEVKILDFGIVKATQRVSQTESGTVKGNVSFMSPEQARGQVVDHRSDLFSTGLVILNALTGEPTYQGETFYELLNAAAAGPTAEQRAHIAALPMPLPLLLDRALEVDPDLRFQSAAEFGAAIAPFLTGPGERELARRVVALFGEELRAEQERLAGALPRAPHPDPFEGAGLASAPTSS